MSDLTQDRLKELLHYCPDLGIFWWKAKPEIDGQVKAWNTRWAGEIAGTRMAEGYGMIRINRRPYYVHRLAWFYMNGEWPPHDIDHRNRRRLDNAFDNLRTATRSQNLVNKKVRSGSRTGMKGVTLLPSGRFRAVIAGQHIATFATAEEAQAAYQERAVQKFGEFACTE